MDFDVMGETTEDNQRKIVVLLVAARRDIVDKHVQALESGGVEPFVLDVESFAVIRALVAQGRTGTNGGATAFVDLGGETTDIVITEGDQLRLTRNINVGAGSLTAGGSERAELGEARAGPVEKEERVLLLGGG